MHQNSVTSDSAGAITRYFAKANLPTQQETLGEIVTEIWKMDVIWVESRFVPNFFADWNKRQGKRNRNIIMH